MDRVTVGARAERQRLIAGLVAFFGGFFLSIVGAIVLACYVAHFEGWWRAIHIGFHLIIWPPIIVGGLCAVGAISICDRLAYGKGIYRCRRCGRALRSWRIPCICIPKAQRELLNDPGFWRGIWREAKPE